MYFTPKMTFHFHISCLLRSSKHRSIVEDSIGSNDPSHPCLSFTLFTTTNSLSASLLKYPKTLAFTAGLLFASLIWLSVRFCIMELESEEIVSKSNEQSEFKFPAVEKLVMHKLLTLKLTGPGGLKELLKTYGLLRNLNKNDARAKMIEFSESPEMCDQNKPGKKCPHKAPHNI
ncbi:hypothetical protein Moror_2127 [Moniliophthora roreri MCA 2997]|uniref:Uncharacterized protein n=1 Tax=Moniliophthora roreri (strain MCA 2997) TaxID=1381753 RepID=V2WU44_MONRO|nr:hypothetical protein Moror_2127 [Moniliophthora roreri MCA 2997]